MHWTEAEALAALVVGLDPDGNVIDSNQIEHAIDDRFGVDMETFQKIAEALLPFTIMGVTALNNTRHHGYVHKGAFICKTEVAPQ